MAYQDIEAAQLQTLLQREDLVILDTRDMMTRGQGQLPNAQAASEAVIADLLRRRRQDPGVLVYCDHGNSSRDLCRFLSQLGLNQVYNLTGGWAAWSRFSRDAAPAVDAQWLLRRGLDPADLNARDAQGMSALMLAVREGDKQTAEKLLSAGADPNLLNNDDNHALWFACVMDSPALVALLIEHGANIDNQNVNGATCAIYAASSGKPTILQALIDAGADLSLRTLDDFDVFDSASSIEVLRLLRPLMRKAG